DVQRRRGGLVPVGGGGGFGFVVAGEELEEQGDDDHAEQKAADGYDGSDTSRGLDRRSRSGRERTLGEAGAAFFTMPVAGGVGGAAGRADGGLTGRGRRTELESLVFVFAGRFVVVTHERAARGAELLVAGHGCPAVGAHVSCHGLLPIRGTRSSTAAPAGIVPRCGAIADHHRRTVDTGFHCHGAVVAGGRDRRHRLGHPPPRRTVMIMWGYSPTPPRLPGDG